MSLVIVAQPHSPFTNPKTVRVFWPRKLGDVAEACLSVALDCHEYASGNLALKSPQIVL